jgi:hypothetical protein
MDTRRPNSSGRRPESLFDSVIETSIKSSPAGAPPSFNPGEAAPPPAAKPMPPRDLLHAIWGRSR